MTKIAIRSNRKYVVTDLVSSAYKLLLIPFAFFLVFQYKVMNVVEISNILFCIIFLLGYISNMISFKRDDKVYMFFALHVLAMIVSIIGYNIISGDSFGARELLQFLFSLQNIIFCLRIKLDVAKFEKFIVWFCLLACVVMGVLFFKEKVYLNIDQIFKDRFWGERLPGWPNYIVVPLIVGCFICMKEKKYFIGVIIAICAIITTSRAAILGVGLIFVFFILKYVKKRIGLLTTCFLLFGLGAAVGILIYLVLPSFYWRLFYADDRVSLFNVTWEAFIANPIFGNGGRTLDQLSNPEAQVWGHTHNWIFELLVRYGLFGFITFCLFFFRNIKDVKSVDYVFIIFVFLFLALFQTYMRMFSYIFFLTYFINAGRQNKPEAALLAKTKDVRRVRRGHYQN